MGIWGYFCVFNIIRKNPHIQIERPSINVVQSLASTQILTWVTYKIISPWDTHRISTLIGIIIIMIIPMVFDTIIDVDYWYHAFINTL